MRLYKAVAIFTALSLLPLVPASATDTKPRVMSRISSDSFGLIINEDSASMGVTYSGINASSGSESLSNYYPCTSLQDSNCKKSEITRIGGIAVLSPCSVTPKQECIDTLSAIDKLGVKHNATYSRSIDANTFQGDLSKGLPEGGSISLWKFDQLEGNKEFAIVVVEQISNKPNDLTSFQRTSFKAFVYAYQERVVPQARKAQPVEVKLSDGRSSINSPGPIGGVEFNCIWVETGRCGAEQQLDPETQLQLSLKVPNSMTGWLRGRLIDPEIQIKALDKAFNMITVKAKPADVPMVAATIKMADASEKILNLLKTRGMDTTKGGSFANVYSYTSEAFTYLDAFSKSANDTASSKSYQWSFGSLESSGTNGCLTSKSRLLGLITTNSMIFEDSPPEFKNGFLQYKVGGLHNNPDGTAFKGAYDLVIDSAAARCLYKFSKAPISAVISVVSSNGENQVATTTVTEKNNWLHLAAYNFSFSSPTIKIKLKQKKTKSK